MKSDEKHPIVAALLALLGVGLVIGLLLGLVTLAASHVAGLGGDGQSGATDAGPSLYLPSPTPTQSSGAAASVSPSSLPSATSRATKSAPAKQITLQSSETSVSPMQRIDLTGVYPGGEGAVLHVQRKGAGGSWQDFPVTTSVSGQTFSTYIQTGQSGTQKFRMRDSDSGTVSNAVSVTVR
ncbi:hypothetical protein [Nocardioides sp. AN3]